MKPHISAPVMDMPKSDSVFMVVMDTRRSVQVAALSPVQCAVCLPEPMLVERDNTKGFWWGWDWRSSSAWRVALASINP
eukprot:CAMPEP_0173304758 /NCGR_PEP_ID=MMETSP1143-20121109/19617_1 /TAXON_ID=483371 /ORGANISM="non described non described, Strain CCMP2298" /LENGTH=78 /DNA_ID=CAMNT_0014245603 /DNA_START=426 /DNA_END=662 /DNA_ORIENTATION=+